MSLTAGIVGLPNVGKSTLFNAITKSQVEAANYPFATIAPNVGVVKVNDPRLEEIRKRIESTTTIPTTFEFTDIAGLVKGASKGEGLGNQFLANIREVDAIIHVVRCFDNDDITHVSGRVDPIDDIEIIEIELMLADLETVQTRIGRIGKRATVDPDAKQELVMLQKAEKALENNEPLINVDFTDEELRLARTFHFLTLKPMIYAANIDEDSITDANSNEHYLRVKEHAKNHNKSVVWLSAKVEEDLSSLDDDEKKEFLLDIGVEESGLDLLVKRSYEILNLRTFFTAGPKEIRAWTYKAGMRAPECAGVIHTDFETGFIRAETFSYDDLIKYGSEQAVQEAGRLRLEGKDYMTRDGDIMHFRFNV